MPRLPPSHRHPYPGLPCPPGTRVLVIARYQCYWGVVLRAHDSPQFPNARYVQGNCGDWNGWHELRCLYPVADAPTREIGD